MHQYLASLPYGLLTRCLNPVFSTQIQGFSEIHQGFSEHPGASQDLG
jgi:hypothetical protein